MQAHLHQPGQFLQVVCLAHRVFYSGDKGVTKIENLNAIHQRFNDAPYDFIDDSLRNLSDLDMQFNQTRTFLRLILASWGYIGPDDERAARSLGYSVFLQEDLIAVLGQRILI